MGLLARVHKEMVRPRFWAWCTAGLALLYGGLFASALADLLQQGFTPAASAAMVGRWEFIIVIYGLPGFLMAVLTGSVLYLFRQDRVYWQRGARSLVRSVAEARTVINLTTEERARVGRSSTGLEVAFCCFLLVLVSGGMFAVGVLKSTEFLLVAALGVLLLVVTSRFGLTRRRYEDALASTAYARSNGITTEDFHRPWYYALCSNRYYNEALPDMDSSPFETQSQ